MDVQSSHPVPLTRTTSTNLQIFYVNLAESDNISQTDAMNRIQTCTTLVQLVTADF